MKRTVVFDALMLLIVIVTVLNYAEQITIDPKLLIMLVTIALYVVYMTLKHRHKSDVEGFEGSSVAFDKEAFINLNKIVNELVKQDQVIIPGNLVVKGKIECEGDVWVGVGENSKMRIADGRIGNKQGGDIRFDTDGWKRCRTWDTEEYNKGVAASDLYCANGLDTGTISNRGDLKNVGMFICDGPSKFQNQVTRGTYSHFNWTDGNCYIRSAVVMDASGGTGANIRCHDINAHVVYARSNIEGHDIKARGAITAAGRVQCGDVYTGVVDTDQLKGHAWGAAGHIHVPQGLIMRHSSGHEIRIWDNKIGLFAPNGVTIPTGALYLTERKHEHRGRIYITNKDGFDAQIYENGDGYIKTHPFRKWWSN